MDWVFLKRIWVLSLVITVFFGNNCVSAKGINFPGALLENGKSEVFVPIPLPWKDETSRLLEVVMIVKTDNVGHILSGQSTEKHFNFDLWLRDNGSVEFKLNINGQNAATSLEALKPDREQGTPFEITFTVDFDKKSVLLVGERLPYYLDLDKNDDSLVIEIGGEGITHGCIAIKDLFVSGNKVKLEHENRVTYCDPQLETVIGEEKIVLDDRGQGHQDDAGSETPVHDETTDENDAEDESEMSEASLEKATELEDELEQELEKEKESDKKEEMTAFEKNQQESIDKKLDELIDQPGILDAFKRTTKNAGPISLVNPPNCFPQQRAYCGANARDCVGTPNVDNRDPGAEYTCFCKSGYSGKRCQFSLLPRSCYEAFAMNTGPINEPGVYELDVDGSGPLLSVWATCAQNGLTVVEHNMPNETIIREPHDPESKNHTINGKMFRISYRLFPQIALNHLINNSFNCKQKVTYNCDNSPLSFSSNLTWFEIHTGQMIKQIGVEPDSCPCNDNDCDKKRKCKCDKLGIATDEGFLVGKNAGIINVFAVESSLGNGVGKMTLSPLMCEGKAGHDPDNAVTLKSKKAALDYSSPEDIKFFEFEFRTFQDTIDSLVAFQTGEFVARISLKNAHTIQLLITEGAETLVDTSIMSQSKLNDLYWHRMLIEVIYEEIRIAIDDLNDFKVLHKSGLASNVRFGSFEPELDKEDGFIGCIRNVIVNRNRIDIDEFHRSSSELFGNQCPNLCAGHNCEQESKCIEHFDTGKRSCKCKNKFVHKGERCETNLNVGSEISFHDHQSAYLRYNNSELRFNPLNSTVALSIRTDQKQAVLLFAHDQSDNLLQVVLNDEYSIVLSMSNYTGDNTSQIVSCTVYSHKHMEFSDMRWLQIVVERFADRTTLSVDDEQCEIKGPIVLAGNDVKINEYGTESTDIILPPQAAGIVKVVEPFYYLFIGGVNSPYVSTFKRKRSIMPIYRSYIPVFLGCAKGLVVGEQFINIRDGGLRPIDKNAIQSGCYTDCESLVCHNGGHCTYIWENRSPLLSELTSCDCSKTSFYGSTCLKDSGVTFEGQQSLLYLISESHDLDLTYDKRRQSYRFAFSPSAGRKSTQRIATAYFNDDTELQVTLNENQSINVFYTGTPENVYTFDGNFTDGYRHFFQADFDQREEIRVVIDSKRHYFPKNVSLNLANVLKFRFGGSDISEDGTTVLDPYYGCISNINIDFHRNRKTIFEPLVYYLNNTIDTSRYLINEPDASYKLNSATCGSFKVAGVLPSMQRNVDFPQWEALFAPVEFTPNFTPDEGIDVEADDDGLPFWLWVLIALALILLILTCIFCICCKNKKRPPPIGSGARPDHDPETVPLKPFNAEPSSPISVEDNFDIPKATQPLFKNGAHVPDRPSVSNDELPPPPESHKEYPDKELDSMDAYSIDENDIDKQLANGFGEERPNIMDKKMYNMLEKTSPNRQNSFGKDDITQPIHSPKGKLTPAAIPQIS